MLKCRNSSYFYKSFPLSIEGVERYQRNSQTFISEAILGLIQDNSILEQFLKDWLEGLISTALNPPWVDVDDVPFPNITSTIF